MAIPLSGRVSGRASGPSRYLGHRRRWIAMCSGKVIGCLGFSRRGVFIGEGASSEVALVGLTIGGCWPAPGHAPWWCVAHQWISSGSSSVFWKLCEISGRLALVLSNSENISCVTFLKHKNSRKQGTSTMASCAPRISPLVTVSKVHYGIMCTSNITISPAPLRCSGSSVKYLHS
jgi:hypothetical protein